MSRTKTRGCELEKTVTIKAGMNAQWTLFFLNPLFFYGLTNSWTVVTHRKALAKARPFIPCSVFWSLQGFFFSTGPTLFPLRGITSIKITGLGDQLLLRVLSLPSSVAQTHQHVPTSVWIIVEGYRVCQSPEVDGNTWTKVTIHFRRRHLFTRRRCFT